MMMNLFSKKTKPPTEAEAVAAFHAAVRDAIKVAREANLHPQQIANLLNGHAGETMAPIYRAQERRQFA